MKEHHLVRIQNDHNMSGVGKNIYYHCTKCGDCFYTIKDTMLYVSFMNKRYRMKDDVYQACHRKKAYIIDSYGKLLKRSYCRFSLTELTIKSILE